MSTVQHRLECTECSRWVRHDSFSEAREAWRRHHDETDHYMTWTAPTEPPTAAVGVKVWIARCPRGDLRSVFDSEDVARHRVRKHAEETNHTDSTVDAVRWYTSRRSWVTRRVFSPGEAGSFLLFAVVSAASGLLVYQWTTPVLGTLTFLVNLILLCLILYLIRRSNKNKRHSRLYRP